MKTLNVSISDIEYNKFGLKDSNLNFRYSKQRINSSEFR
jgi:hypothetical protein